MYSGRCLAFETYAQHEIIYSVTHNVVFWFCSFVLIDSEPNSYSQLCVGSRLWYVFRHGYYCFFFKTFYFVLRIARSNLDSYSCKGDLGDEFEGQSLNELKTNNNNLIQRHVAVIPWRNFCYIILSQIYSE